MTYKEAHDVSQDWKRKIFLVSMWHNARKAKMKTWGLTDTAKYFDRSVGYISESLMLMEYYTSVIDCKSRNEALKRLKANGENLGTSTN